MKQPSGSLIMTFTIIMVVAAIFVALFILIRPIQAGQAVLPGSVNVAATAQAIQSNNRQKELDATGQAQKTTWESQIAAQQQSMTEFDQTAQRQLEQLQAQHSQLQTQINQVTASIQTTQAKISELQQAISTDQAKFQAELAALEVKLNQHETELENELGLTQTELQAARAQLGGSQGTQAEEQDHGTNPADDSSSSSQ